MFWLITGHVQDLAVEAGAEVGHVTDVAAVDVVIQDPDLVQGQEVDGVNLVVLHHEEVVLIAVVMIVVVVENLILDLDHVQDPTHPKKTVVLLVIKIRLFSTIYEKNKPIGKYLK